MRWQKAAQTDKLNILTQQASHELCDSADLKMTIGTHFLTGNFHP